MQINIEEIVKEYRQFAGADALNEEWLRQHLFMLSQQHQDELREVVMEAIRLSDEAERGNKTEFNEWRAFKGFRNGLRDYAQTRGIDISDKTNINVPHK